MKRSRVSSSCVNVAVEVKHEQPEQMEKLRIQTSAMRLVRAYKSKSSKAVEFGGFDI